MVILGIITDFIVKDVLTVEGHLFNVMQPAFFPAFSEACTQTSYVSPEPFAEYHFGANWRAFLQKFLK